MILYCTPGRLRTMGLGADLSSLSDIEIASIISRASSRVNALTAAPNRPEQHDFRGGTITGEQHQWRTARSETDMSQKQVFLFHWPIISVEDMIIRVTNQQIITFADEELVITDRYVEIASFAMTLQGAVLTPVIGLTTPIVETDYTYGERFTSTGERLYPDPGSTTVYRAQNGFWTEGTIYLNGVEQPGANVDLDEGTVTFVTNPDPAVVTATYTYKLDHDIMEACALLAAQEIDETDLRSKGLSGLHRVKVGEIEMERPRETSSGSAPGSGDPTHAPAKVLELLEGRRMIWAGS